jgi:hypothetical protein
VFQFSLRSFLPSPLGEGLGKGAPFRATKNPLRATLKKFVPQNYHCLPRAIIFQNIFLFL